MSNPGQPTIALGATGAPVRRLQRALLRTLDLGLAWRWDIRSPARLSAVRLGAGTGFAVGNSMQNQQASTQQQQGQIQNQQQELESQRRQIQQLQGNQSTE
jgi:hypothetical protein